MFCPSRLPPTALEPLCQFGIRGLATKSLPVDHRRAGTGNGAQTRRASWWLQALGVMSICCLAKLIRSVKFEHIRSQLGQPPRPDTVNLVELLEVLKWSVGVAVSQNPC